MRDAIHLPKKDPKKEKKEKEKKEKEQKDKERKEKKEKVCVLNVGCCGMPYVVFKSLWLARALSPPTTTTHPFLAQLSS